MEGWKAGRPAAGPGGGAAPIMADEATAAAALKQRGSS
eukprot:COSAG01_NODE_48954_length_376_cov_1.104693_1_plen_37_part_10